MEYRGRHVRFPVGPGTEIDGISSAYVAAIRDGDDVQIEFWRNEIYRVTAHYVAETRPRDRHIPVRARVTRKWHQDALRVRAFAKVNRSDEERG